MIQAHDRIEADELRKGAVVSEYVVDGAGEPTIVFEAGLGDGLKVWSAVISELKGVTRSFAYNRAGYGESRSPHKVRDGLVIVEELRSLLRELNYTPPHILVGHSLGSAYMEIFAQTHPEEVCGLLLVDPMTSEMDELCREEGITEWNTPLFRRILISLFMPRAAKRELRMRKRALTQRTERVPSANAFPVTIITAGKGMWSSRLQAAWLNSHLLLAKQYSNCCHVVEKESGHHVQTDNPRFVAAQILSLLERTSVNQ